MKIKELKVFCTLKNSLPNYGSVEYGAGMTVEVGEGEDKNKIMRYLWLYCQTEILEQTYRRINNPDLKKEYLAKQEELFEAEGGGFTWQVNKTK